MEGKEVEIQIKGRATVRGSTHVPYLTKGPVISVIHVNTCHILSILSDRMKRGKITA